MRLLPVVILASLAMSPSAVAATGNGQIAANTIVTRNGYQVGCTSALLIPRSPIADRNVKLVFGRLDGGTAKPADFAGADLKARLPGTRANECTNYRRRGGSLFSDVPAGEYYVVLRLLREENTSSKPMTAFEELVMRRVAVAPGDIARLRFH